MKTKLLLACLLGALVSVALHAEPRKPDYERGWRLHDDACTGCHGASMYARPYNERNPYFTVRKQVEIWQDFIDMRWTPDQIDDVAYYVRKRFYEKSCDATC